MKKLIKDWWPLLLIAGWLLWKRHEKRKLYGQNQSNGQIPPRPPQQQLIGDYIRQLEKAGYVPKYPCHCGSTLYVKYHQYPEGYPPQAIPLGGGIDAKACTNPNCENFDPRFVLY